MGIGCGEKEGEEKRNKKKERSKEKGRSGLEREGHGERKGSYHTGTYFSHFKLG